MTFSGGNVGIGTTSPTSALDIASGNIALSTTGTNKIILTKSLNAGASLDPGLYSYGNGM